MQLKAEKGRTMSEAVLGVLLIPVFLVCGINLQYFCARENSLGVLMSLASFLLSGVVSAVLIF
jgi:hypothetical protein